MHDTNIQQVRMELQRWGSFQARQEMGSGYASKSSTAKICEMLRTEIFVSSDLHLFSHLSDNMHEPEHIEIMTYAVNTLPRLQRIELRKKYVYYIEGETRAQRKARMKIYDNYYTREGENSLLGLM